MYTLSPWSRAHSTPVYLSFSINQGKLQKFILLDWIPSHH